MIRRHPSKLALALLNRFVPDSDALAGDLIEQFTRRPSTGWLWFQVLAAIVIARIHRYDDIRPLKLVDMQPADAIERTRRFSSRFSAVNLTGSPVPGVGGLGLVAFGVMVAWALRATAGGL